ncbi:MAG: SdpI family protein [Planctomycetota bacterium]|jgi:uncharacterized membrane protein
MRKTEAILLALLGLCLGTALYLYPHLPNEIPTGWDFEGNIRATMPKKVIVSVFPALLVVFTLVIMVSSRIRPSVEKRQRFRSCYDKLAIVIYLWYLCMMLQMMLWPLGLKVSFFVVFSLGIGVICFYFGILFQKADKDSFIAIRTRWTLSSEQVWSKTHKVGGAGFKMAGIAAVVGAFLPVHYGAFLAVAPLTLVMMGLIVYAYVIGYFKYRRRLRV